MPINWQASSFTAEACLDSADDVHVYQSVLWFNNFLTTALQSCATFKPCVYSVYIAQIIKSGQAAASTWEATFERSADAALDGHVQCEDLTLH